MEIADLGSSKISRQTMNEMYMDRVLSALGLLDQVVANLNGVTDTRPVLLARKIICYTLDDKIRSDLLARFDLERQKIIENNKDNQSRCIFLNELAVEVCGECVSYLDEYLNIHKKNIVEEA